MKNKKFSIKPLLTVGGAILIGIGLIKLVKAKEPCTCTNWENKECVSNTQRRQIRTCNPSGCDIEERIINDPSCAIEPPPTGGIVYGRSYKSTKAAIGEEVYLMFRCDNTSSEKICNWFVKVIDEDTNQVLFSAVGNPNNCFYPKGQNNSFRWFKSTFTMPNREFKLRMESGHSGNIDDTHSWTIPLVPPPSNRDIMMNLVDFYATSPVSPGQKIQRIYLKFYNRGTDIGYAKYEVIDVDTGKVLESPGGFKVNGGGIRAVGTSQSHGWNYYVIMPNKNFHIQARAYHKDPATRGYLLDSALDFTIMRG